MDEVTQIINKALIRMRVNNAQSRRRLIIAVLTYINRDREHFIALADPDNETLDPSPRQGKVCKLIPLARNSTPMLGSEVNITDTTLLALMVTEEETCLVLTEYRTTLYTVDGDLHIRFPVYRKITPDEIPPEMHPRRPELLIPVATELEQRALCMAFRAFEKVTKDMDVLCIPHKTERAMLMLHHATVEELLIEDSLVAGKVIPIAIERSAEEVKEDQYLVSRTEEFCLLVTQEEVRYVIRTHVRHNYYKDAARTNPFYEFTLDPEEERRELLYRYATIDQIKKTMLPHYN